MLVSVIVGLLNEDFKKQTYDHDEIELIFIDGMSKDSSWKILEDFKNSNHDFYDVVLLKNPKVILSAGMNVGIKAARGECILKVDCHSHITDNFIENNVKIIEQGEDVCGGPRPNIIENADNFSKTLLLVEENMFGSSIASYRKSDEDRYVDSIFHGMYRKEVFEKAGLLNEKLIRTEDNEIHYRIRKNGFKIKYSKDILSYQYIRPTLKKMLKQKYSNGYWIGLTSHVEFKCLSIFHFVPLAFVLAIIFSLCMIPITSIFIILLSSVYFLFTILITIMTIINNKFNITILLMPIILFLIHVYYGVGTLVGLIKGFSWKNEYYSD